MSKIDHQQEALATSAYLKELYKDLEKKLKRYSKLDLTDREKARRLSKLRVKIIECLVRLEELNGSIN